jgi:RNA polymerase sigma factor (sigma-70 family)
MSQRDHSIRTSAQPSANTVGLILLDAFLNPTYVNSTAQQVFYAMGNRSVSKNAIQEVIPSEILNSLTTCERELKRTVLSGRRQYVCRKLMLEPPGLHSDKAHCAIVLERLSRRNENLRRLTEHFALTARERDVVKLLHEGLTSKEIAQRLNISAHTVKRYLHFIMTKLGVTTRSGIVGKVSSAPSDDGFNGDRH